MKRRVFGSIFFTSFLVLIITAAAVMYTVYNKFTDERKEEIRIETVYIQTAYDGDTDYLKAIGKNSQNRITLVAGDGTVLYDSFADAASLENHSDRPEIAAALSNGVGEAMRSSGTLDEKTYYYAVRLDDGSVLRVAATMKSILKIFDSTATVIVVIMLLALVLAAVSARLMTSRIVAPLNKLDLERPLENSVYEELSPLLVGLDKQNKKIAEQLETLSENKREFEEITDTMSEALVVFGTDKKVISANRSAKQIFQSFEPTGCAYPEFCRDRVYLRVMESAFSCRAAEEKYERRGRIYRLSANPVIENDGCAAVLLAVDITESERAGQLRREFSANVSHELKTPLTTILGCAEIMQNGIAKAEDYPRFTEQIYTEAKRLLSLIEDIIKLSRLDEGEIQNEFTSVNLKSLSEKVASELAQKAASLSVNLSVIGDNLAVNGIESTLHEMIFNLCDNAVTYNREGGGVRVIISTENDRPVLTVADDGIGIAPEHQARVFERFYRVDKSHSRETGGTGLGLSIVKHGAAIHGAVLRLSSTLGKGTEISIMF